MQVSWCIHRAKLIKLYTLNKCSLLYVNHTSKNCKHMSLWLFTSFCISTLDILRKNFAILVNTYLLTKYSQQGFLTWDPWMGLNGTVNSLRLCEKMRDTAIFFFSPEKGSTAIYLKGLVTLRNDHSLLYVSRERVWGFTFSAWIGDHTLTGPT